MVTSARSLLHALFRYRCNLWGAWAHARPGRDLDIDQWILFMPIVLCAYIIVLEPVEFLLFQRLNLFVLLKLKDLDQN